MHSAGLVNSLRSSRHSGISRLKSISVIANRSEAERWRLTDEELTPQLAWVLLTVITITFGRQLLAHS